MTGALAIRGGALAVPHPIVADRFDAKLRIFDAIPPYHYDVVTLYGLVFVYDKECLGREEIREDELYVRESQHPVANMQWESWLRFEVEDAYRHRRAQPRSPLKTSREIVRIIRYPGEGGLWGLRMASGFTDGPLQHWNLGYNFVGKVVGLYVPRRAPEAAE